MLSPDSNTCRLLQPMQHAAVARQPVPPCLINDDTASATATDSILIQFVQPPTSRLLICIFCTFWSAACCLAQRVDLA